ncbi:unnamed protein product [Triticum turgidum subsp. durum]|uniref:Myotubularin phosphatase domain-containing protein n=1 Tax=Triticum turgidum subsp. durum TaxID=4567 RepID=A0A9R0ZZT7_TRITD|nr:unnamed protein product [Triticum turgidum subsp. durum]
MRFCVFFLSRFKDPRSRRSSQGMEEFLLEDEEVYAQGHGVVLLNTDEAGIVSVTNFRLLFVSQATKSIIELGTIPLSTIEKLNDDVKLQSVPRQYDKKQPRELLQVIGKDMRVIVFAFRPRTKQKNEVFDALRRYAKPSQLWELYAFSCDPSTVDKKSDPKMRLMKEYHRLLSEGSEFEVEKYYFRNNWRLTTVNSSYSLCSTYPSQLIVPKSISDEDLWQASTFRAGRRLPIISWCNPVSGAVLARSSQPLVGLMMNFRNNADEKLVSALCIQNVDANLPPRKLYIVDARPRANALANGAKGGGSESSSNYPKSERNRGSTWGGGSLNSMTQFSSMLGEWLNHIQNILVGASWIAAQIAQESASVLVHCSDGWDRTTQLIALACLLLDPYYRTFDGFQALVEKDWLAFGHPFAERLGIPTVSENGGSQYELLRQPSVGNLTSSPSRGSLGTPGSSSNTSVQSQTSNNSSPILLQWLDCIAQLLRLYPAAFQFSSYSAWLIFIPNASEREREQSGVTSSCHCMWTYLADLRASGGSFHEHINPFYDRERLISIFLVLIIHKLADKNSWLKIGFMYSFVFSCNGQSKDMAESRSRDIKMKMESMLTDLQRERRASSSALAMAQRARRENVAIKRAIQTIGCTVNFSTNENQVDKSEEMSYSFRREADTVSQQDDNADMSVSISAIEDSLVSETPSNQVCESLCPFRSREGCRWPHAACAQLGSQFVGLKANFDAFDRLSVKDCYFPKE